MSLTIPKDVLEATTHKSLDYYRQDDRAKRLDHELTIKLGQADDDLVADILAAAKKVKHKLTIRALEAIIAARSGAFSDPVPNFKAFEAMLRAFLAAEATDGWIYVQKPDGRIYPELVTGISFDDGRSQHRGVGRPCVTIHTTHYGYRRDGNYRVDYGVQRSTHTFYGESVARRRVADILANRGIYRETADLRASYDASMKRYDELVRDQFGRQFRMNGSAFAYEGNDQKRLGTVVKRRKVIHDLEPEATVPLLDAVESDILGAIDANDGMGVIPRHCVIRVFDLQVHEFLWVGAEQLTPYKYDHSLRSKLILPPTHHDLLEVLTTDTDMLTEDFIEGKSAGNVVLCKGPSGVGKTLTAEVYAELTDRALYSVHSGTLGTTPADIEKNLREILQRAKRWHVVILLDEADIFVSQRGSDLTRNAITGEFLRVLEYYDGLIFMTTNRPDDIDDAMISRCIAIIDFTPPDREGADMSWKVMSKHFQADLSPELIEELLDLFPSIAQRDMKMLIRLVLKWAHRRDLPVDLDLFRKAAMFRAIKMNLQVAA